MPSRYILLKDFLILLRISLRIVLLIESVDLYLFLEALNYLYILIRVNWWNGEVRNWIIEIKWEKIKME